MTKQMNEGILNYSNYLRAYHDRLAAGKEIGYYEIITNAGVLIDACLKFKSPQRENILVDSVCKRVPSVKQAA